MFSSLGRLPQCPRPVCSRHFLTSSLPGDLSQSLGPACSHRCPTFNMLTHFPPRYLRLACSRRFLTYKLSGCAALRSAARPRSALLSSSRTWIYVLTWMMRKCPCARASSPPQSVDVKSSRSICYRCPTMEVRQAGLVSDVGPPTFDIITDDLAYSIGMLYHPSILCVKFAILVPPLSCTLLEGFLVPFTVVQIIADSCMYYETVNHSYLEVSNDDHIRYHGKDGSSNKPAGTTSGGLHSFGHALPNKLNVVFLRL